jgi:hypothetical protein
MAQTTAVRYLTHAVNESWKSGSDDVFFWLFTNHPSLIPSNVFGTLRAPHGRNKPE